MGFDLNVGVQGGQLFAQVGDVYPDDGDLRVAVAAPDLFQKPLCRDHMVRIGHQQFAHLELLVRQPKAARRGGQRESRAVQRDAAERQSGIARRPAAGDRAQRGEQFLGVEGLGEVVVGAAVKPLHLVVHLRLGGQQQHRDRIPGRAQPPEHGDAVGLRHHNVQHRHVVLARFQIRQSVLAVFHRVDGKEILFEDFHERTGQRPFILCKQDAHIRFTLLRDLLFCVYFAPRT